MAGLSFAELIDTLLEGDPRRARVLTRVYSVLVSEARVVAQLFAGRDLRTTPYPCAVVVTDGLSGFELDEIRAILVRRDNRFLQVVKKRTEVLLEGTHLLLMAPVLTSENETDNSLAFRSFDLVMAVVAMNFGRLPFRQLIAEFEMERTGRVIVSSNTVGIPVSSDTVEYSSPLSNQIALALAEKRASPVVELANKLFAKAIVEPDPLFRFAGYWLALEVLVGGKAPAIRGRLQQAYGVPSHAYVEQDLHFETVSRMRHNLFHRGEFVDLAPYQERLLIGYFWDIMATSLGFECPRFAEAVLSTPEAQAERHGLTSIGRLPIPKHRS